MKDLVVDGDTVKKYKPKMPEKYIGILLRELLDKVFTNQIQNTEEELIKEIKEYEYR